MEEKSWKLPTKKPRIKRNHLWGFGIYLNPNEYRYITLQVGPWYIYLHDEEPKEIQITDSN